jgi:hypothetical protein
MELSKKTTILFSRELHADELRCSFLCAKQRPVLRLQRNRVDHTIDHPHRPPGGTHYAPFR